MNKINGVTFSFLVTLFILKREFKINELASAHRFLVNCRLSSRAVCFLLAFVSVGCAYCIQVTQLAIFIHVTSLHFIKRWVVPQKNKKTAMKSFKSVFALIFLRVKNL